MSFTSQEPQSIQDETRWVKQFRKCLKALSYMDSVKQNDFRCSEVASLAALGTHLKSMFVSARVTLERRVQLHCERRQLQRPGVLQTARGVHAHPRNQGQAQARGSAQRLPVEGVRQEGCEIDQVSGRPQEKSKAPCFCAQIKTGPPVTDAPLSIQVSPTNAAHVAFATEQRPADGPSLEPRVAS